MVGHKKDAIEEKSLLYTFGLRLHFDTFGVAFFLIIPHKTFRKMLRIVLYIFHPFRPSDGPVFNFNFPIRIHNEVCIAPLVIEGHLVVTRRHAHDANSLGYRPYTCRAVSVGHLGHRSSTYHTILL